MIITTTATTTAPLQPSRTTAHWNQKQAVKNFLKQYATKFDVESDAMDLRTMANNYNHGIIPLEDIHQGVMALLGPNYDPLRNAMYDPTNDVNHSPKFAYVKWDQMFLYSIFQRDVASNHVAKLMKDWDHTSVLIPCAIKFTLDGKIYYCVWDGHHTLQGMRLRNYTDYPVWYIDIDDIPDNIIAAAGFATDDEGRVKYGSWLAGRNMIRINATNKRPLAHYDKFMILLDTLDAKAVKMKSIIDATGCIVKRGSKAPGAWTQINSGEECYDLLQGNGLASNGIFWRHALEFHRKVWPLAPLELEVFRPMSYLYQLFNVGGYQIDAQFDTELEQILTTKYGDPETVQLEIKKSYENAIANNLGRGQLLKSNREIVMAGLINLYNQHCGRIAVMPPADYVWSV